MESSDPIIHEHERKWWFWDEVWGDRMGPYDTEEEARKKLKEYVVYLDTGEIGGSEPGSSIGL